jgi:hypothetical protein
VSTAVVMMTHRFDAVILDEFERMREALDAGDQAFLLNDGSSAPPDAFAAATHVFRFDVVSRRAVRVIGGDILRNVHLAWLDFFDAHPGFDDYWLIEFDVRFSGPWRELFDAFRPLPCDLLCSHLRSIADEPGWHWWDEIRAPGEEIESAQKLRGFLPISRLSQRGFACLRDGVAAGWHGFLEGLVPTLLQHFGLHVADIGGDGPFVPEGFRNRFYTSVGDPTGALVNLGSMRYRAPIAFPRIQAGRLYHPVKPETCRLDAGVDTPQRALGALAQAMAMVRTRLARERDGSGEHYTADFLLQVLTGVNGAALLDALETMQSRLVDASIVIELRGQLLELMASDPHVSSSRMLSSATTS